MQEQTATEPDSWTSFFGPGIALRTRGFQLVVEDVSHWNVFLGVLATLIGVSSVAVLLAIILDHQIGLYLFALCMASLIPIVVVLMAKRKLIIDLLRKKIKRTTNRRLFWQESKVIPVLSADRAEKRIVKSVTGKLMSKVVLVLDNSEDFDVTMFADMMNLEFKDTIVEKINYYLQVAKKTANDREDSDPPELVEETTALNVQDENRDDEESGLSRKGKERLVDSGSEIQEEKEESKTEEATLIVL
jgi:hypothetical protein